MKICSTILYGLIQSELKLPTNLRTVAPHLTTQKKNPPAKLPQRVKYSTNNQPLQKKIMSEGYTPQLCTKQFYYNYYTNISLNRLDIRVIDSQISRFQKLTYLGVMCNQISVLENLPAGLIEVQASFNCITNFRQHGTLERLSVVKNGLDEQNVRQIVAYYPSLTYLDLSNNHLHCMDTLITHLQKLRALTILGLQGNPLHTQQNYKLLVQALPELRFIDGRKVEEVVGRVMLTQPEQCQQVDRRQEGSVISDIKAGVVDQEEQGLGSMLGSVQAQDTIDL